MYINNWYLDENNGCYSLPKFLFSFKYEKLSLNAKFLYSFILEEYKVNRKLDDKDNMYINLSRGEMQKRLNISQPTVATCMKDLKEYGLLDEKTTRKMGEYDNRIYLLKPAVDISFDKQVENQSKVINYEQRSLVAKLPEYMEERVKQIMEDVFEKEVSAEDYNIEQIQGNNDEMYQPNDIYQVVKFIKKQIDFDNIVTRTNFNLLNEIVMILFDTYFSNESVIKIDGVDRPTALVIDVLKQITSYHVLAVIEDFKNCTKRIIKIRAYLLTMLYNSVLEMNFKVTNEVKSDLN